MFYDSVTRGVGRFDVSLMQTALTRTASTQIAPQAAVADRSACGMREE